MTGYSHADLADGWEFKILRSATGAFRNPERMRQAIDEESRNGWVFLEKFDNQRLRFKRPTSARAGDASHGGDPYRTNFGISDVQMAMTIVGTIFAVMAIAILIVVLATRHSP